MHLKGPCKYTRKAKKILKTSDIVCATIKVPGKTLHVCDNNITIKKIPSGLYIYHSYKDNKQSGRWYGTFPSLNLTDSKMTKTVPWTNWDTGKETKATVCIEFTEAAANKLQDL
jgi:hypothetical protein